MATSSNSFTVSLLVNGITYRITASNGSVDIGSDVSQVNYSSTFQFWQQEAGQSTKSFSCYYAVFTKKGSSYSLIASGGKATSYSLSSRTVYRDGANAIDAFVVCIYDSSHTTHSGYLIELEIPVNRQGNTGEPNISYELTPNVDKIHFKANGNAYSPSSQSLYCGYVKKVGTNDETHVGTIANQIDKSLNSNVFTVFYRFLKTDGTYTTPAKNSSLTNCTLDITSSTPYVSVEFILVDDTTYNANKVITNIAIPISKDGLQGKMGRNLYYAGDSAELAGTTFTVTDTSAPYVSVVSSNGTTCYAFKGENGTYTFPSSSAGYPGTDWEQMFKMKYFISEAIFSNFAKLGSAIFNEDYMFSQYGSLKGYGGIEKPTTNNNWYRFANPSSMSGNVQSPLHESSTETTVSNTFFNTETSRFNITMQTGKYYWLKIRCNAGTNRGVEFKITTLNGSEDILQPTITDGEEHLYGPISVPANGTYYLYYRRTGTVTTNPTIKYSMMSDVTFCPNIYADWVKGFFHAQYAKFKNVVVEGVFNNLITEIDWDNNVNRDLIISWSDNGTTKYCLDILRCGNIVRIKSLPSGLVAASSSSNKTLWLPFFVSSDNYSRTVTKLAKDGTVLTTARNVTADEMKMLVGRKLVLIVEVDDADFAYTSLSTHKFIPKEIENTSPAASELKLAMVDIANGQSVVNASASLSRNDTNIGYPKTVFLECKLLRDNYNAQYCYVWTSNTAYSSYTDNNGIDDSWT